MGSQNASSLSALVSSACRELLSRAAPTIPAPPSDEQKAQALMSSIAHMDLPAAKKAWAVLGALGPEALATAYYNEQGPFATWIAAAKNCVGWGVQEACVTEMLLWLDDIGAPAAYDPPANAITRARIAELAAGGARRGAIRRSFISYWAYLCPRTSEPSPSISKALLALGARWLSDPDPEARLCPSDWIDAAFKTPQGGDLPIMQLGFLAQTWPQFGIPVGDDLWRKISKKWWFPAEARHGQCLASIESLLAMESGALPPDVSNRFGFMAARLGSASLLAKVAARAPEFSLFCENCLELADHHGLPREAIAGPIPLIMIAAFREKPARWGSRLDGAAMSDCFEALASIPEAVSSAVSGGPRPDLVALVDLRRVPDLEARFPSWFEFNAHGENFLHFFAGFPDLTADEIRLAIATCLSRQPLAEMLGAPSSDGRIPCRMLLAAAQALCAAAPSPDAKLLIQEAQMAAEASELSFASRAPPGSAPALGSGPLRL